MTDIVMRVHVEASAEVTPAPPTENTAPSGDHKE